MCVCVSITHKPFSLDIDNIACESGSALAVTSRVKIGPDYESLITAGDCRHLNSDTAWPENTFACPCRWIS